MSELGGNVIIITGCEFLGNSAVIASGVTVKKPAF
jgi:hypothetical protein